MKDKELLIYLNEDRNSQNTVWMKMDPTTVRVGGGGLYMYYNSFISTNFRTSMQLLSFVVISLVLKIS